KAVGGKTLGDFTVFRGDLQGKNEKEYQGAVEEFDEVHGEAEFGEMASLMVAFGRERVGSDFLRSRGLARLCGGRHRGRLLSRWRGGLSERDWRRNECCDEQSCRGKANQQHEPFQESLPGEFSTFRWRVLLGGVWRVWIGGARAGLLLKAASSRRA